jgi:hypothetical protein
MIELLKDKTNSHPLQATAPPARTHQQPDCQLRHQLALSGALAALNGQPTTAEKSIEHWLKVFLISLLHGFYCWFIDGF